ncbi:MAG TPA: NAD(+) synthase [Gemmatimonadales bacterium]|jgi:NAD+ synthase|nr:NAD(+) synthase [Gemmatimonadales bacterium]
MTVAVPEQLRLDPAQATHAIAEALRQQVGTVLRRSGLVVAMSGGIDSSVCAALAVEAVGRKRVVGLALPERESGGESLTMAKELATKLGIELLVEDISATLTGSGCYARRDAAIRRIVPEYDDDWRCKLLAENGGLDSDRLNVAYLAIQPPNGELRKVRLPAREFREIVAATNFKQRVRKMLEYFHADRLHYAVVGTPNRLEYELGFFVKGGDGLADVKPIAHLYKAQVHQLAEHLGVPESIRRRTPTTDTYSLPQTQEEFFFSLPLTELDLTLQARNAGKSATEAAGDIGLTPEQVERAYREIDRKRGATVYQHAAPLLVERVLDPD